VLETSGHKRHNAGEGLSARTVRYLHTTLGPALAEAVEAGELTKSPAAKQKQSKPSTPVQAKAPEIHRWSAVQLSTFLGWSERASPHHAAWRVLAYTGMRRGELLARRWRDIDLARSAVAIRRSEGPIQRKGQGAWVQEADTKNNQPRVVGRCYQVHSRAPAAVGVDVSDIARRGLPLTTGKRKARNLMGSGPLTW
jgi:integrase